MDVNFHKVAEIRIEANSAILPDGEACYWQTLVICDPQGRDLGRVTLHLDNPGVALPVGDQPPYWGIDLTKPLAVQLDGSPF